MKKDKRTTNPPMAKHDSFFFEKIETIASDTNGKRKRALDYFKIDEAYFDDWLAKDSKWLLAHVLIKAQDEEEATVTRIKSKISLTPEELKESGKTYMDPVEELDYSFQTITEKLSALSHEKEVKDAMKIINRFRQAALDYIDLAAGRKYALQLFAMILKENEEAIRKNLDGENAEVETAGKEVEEQQAKNARLALWERKLDRRWLKRFGVKKASNLVDMLEKWQDNAKLQGMVEALEKNNQELRAKIEELEKRIEAMKLTSSKPMEKPQDTPKAEQEVIVRLKKDPQTGKFLKKEEQQNAA